VTARITAYPHLVKLSALFALYREPILRTAVHNVNGEYQKVTEAFYRTAANIFGLRDGEAELHAITAWLTTSRSSPNAWAEQRRNRIDEAHRCESGLR
jgi:hypothetical protein